MTGDRRHESIEGRDAGISKTKGVAVLLVAVIHSADPDALAEWFLHRRLINMAVPVMLVCYGITCRASASRCEPTIMWLRRRAQRIGPISLVALAVLWTLRTRGAFCNAYVFVGGKLPVGLCVVGNALFLPGCVGGFWFVTAFSQILLMTGALVRHAQVVAPVLIAMQVMTRSSLETMHPLFPYAVPPCDANGMLYTTSNAFAHVGYVALGVVHGEPLAAWFGSRPSVVGGAACLVVALVTDYASASKQLLIACECASALVLACASTGCLRRARMPAAVSGFVSFCGDESFPIYIGHVVALNLLVRDFTVSSYELPFEGGFRVAMYILMSVGAGLLTVRVSRALAAVSASKVSPCALLVLCFAASVLQQRQAALVSPSSVPPEGAEAWSKAQPLLANPISPNASYAFFTLVKGGAEEAAFAEYAQRTAALHAAVSGADDIAFHEGNVPAALQTVMEQRLHVAFFDVRTWGAFDERAVSSKLSIRLKGDYATGYKHMCRFFALQWMHALKRYRWVMRVDEDVVVSHVSPHIFRELDASTAVYAYAAEVDELHEETVQTFQPWVDDYAKMHNWSQTIDVKRMFFTNVFASKPEWWLRERVARFLNDVDQTSNIYLHRWGDAPIQSVAVRAFAASHDYAFVPIDYAHGSTNNLIKHGRELPLHRPHRSTPLERVLQQFEDHVLPCLVADVHAPLSDGHGHDDTTHAVDSLRARLMLHTGLGKSIIDPLSASEVIEGVRTAMEDQVFGDYFLSRGESRKQHIASLLHTQPSQIPAAVDHHPCRSKARHASTENFERLKKAIMEARNGKRPSRQKRETRPHS